MEIVEGSTYCWAAINFSKPIMIVETSTVEQDGSKADWIEELYLELPEHFPQLRANLWFNAAWRDDNRANWLANSNPASRQVYRSALEQVAKQAADFGYGSYSSPRLCARLHDLTIPC